MRRLIPFARDQRGASAAEFALVAPLMILFLLGIIDIGRFIWAVNETQKAVQIGARWAVATDIIPGGDADDGLREYSFAISSGVPQGTTVDSTLFPGVTCLADGGQLTCTCKASCPFSTVPGTAGEAAFAALVSRMNDIQPRIGAANVQIDYDHSGLGYAGDPNGPDVAPIVTVSTRDLQFTPIFLLGIFDFGLPGPSYSLTMEDGRGAASN